MALHLHCNLHTLHQKLNMEQNTGPVGFEDVRAALGDQDPASTNAGALRRTLGRGSLSTIQKHLDTLRTQAVQREQQLVALAHSVARRHEPHAIAVQHEQTEAVALAQGQFGDTGREAARGIETRAARAIALRHRRGRIEHDPDRQRTVAFGFTHEAAVDRKSVV